MHTLLNLYLIIAATLTLIYCHKIYQSFSKSFPTHIIFLPSLCLFLFGQRVFIFNIIPICLDLFSGSLQIATYSPSMITVISFGILFCLGSITWVTAFLFSYFKLSRKSQQAEKLGFTDDIFSTLSPTRNSLFFDLSLSIATAYPILAFWAKIGLVPVPMQLIEILSRFLAFSGSILFVVFIKKRLYLKSFIALVAQILSIVLISNTRSTLAFPVLIVFALLLNSRDPFALMRKPIYYVFIILLICLFVLIGSAPKLSLDKQNLELNYSLNSEKNQGRTALQELNYRLGASIRYSFAFYEFPENIHLTLLDNNLEKLTSLLNPSDSSKIIPNSVDRNNLYAQPSHLIYQHYHRSSLVTMSEFEYTALEFWQFGVFGVLISSIVSGLLYGLTALVVRHIFTPYISIVAIMALQIPWTFDPRIPLYYFLFLCYTYYPVLFIFFLLKLRFKI